MATKQDDHGTRRAAKRAMLVTVATIALTCQQPHRSVAAAATASIGVSATVLPSPSSCTVGPARAGMAPTAACTDGRRGLPPLPGTVSPTMATQADGAGNSRITITY